MSGTTRLMNLNPAWWSDEDLNGGAPCAVQFDCPVCPSGCHRLFVPFVGHVWNQPRAIWAKSGDTFEVLSLSPSIFYPNSPCKLHGWVKDGMVTW